MVEIYVLNDDRCTNAKFKNVHGLSLFINADGYKFLFDVGQEDCFLKNASALELDIQNVECIVLSHGHYDHTNGLTKLNKKIKVICHPLCTSWRKSKRTNEYNGLPFSKEEFEQKFDVVYSDKIIEIAKNVYFLGEINRLNNFECKKFPSVLKDGSDDIATDDSGVAIVTDNGLIIISGCSHSGICNIIEQAKIATGVSEIHAVIGGFHLKDIDDQTDETIEYFKNNNIKNLYLGHCTSDKICEYFKENLSSTFNVEILETGSKYNFN